MTESSKPSLGKRAFLSVIWAGLGRVGRAAAQIVFMIVMGRAVGPSGFAAASIALIGYQLVSTVASQSFAQALVRYSDDDPARDATAFWLNIAFSGSLALVICAVSPFTARVLSLPDLVWLMPQLALFATLVAPTAIAQAKLSRDMNFRQVAAIESISAVASVVAGVLSIWLWGLGLEALVIYAGVQRAVECAAFMRHRSSWPTARPVRLALRPLMKFTGPLMSVQILTFANNSVDQFFVGRVNDPTQLGLFSFGRRLTQQPTQMISFAVGRAIFPALVQARETEAGPNALFMTALRLTTLAAALPLLLLAVIATDLVNVLLGPAWTSAGPFLALFAASSITVPLGAICAAALRAEGKTGVQLLLQLFRLSLTIVVLGTCVLLQADAWGMAWAVAAITFTSILPPALVATRCLGIPFARVLVAFGKGILPAAAISVLLAALNLTLLSTLDAVERIMVVALCATIASSILILIRKNQKPK